MASEQKGPTSDRHVSLSRAVRDSVIHNARSLDSLRTVAALVAVILVGLLSPVPDRVLFSLRHHLSSVDVLSALSSSANGVSGSEIVVIALDEAYAEQHRYPEVTPRTYLDSLIRAVAAHNPSVIALDFKFSTADLRDPAFVSLCERLAAETADGPIVVLPTAVQQEQNWYRPLPFPPAHLRRHTLSGYANLRGQPVEAAELTRPMGPDRRPDSSIGQNRPSRIPSFALSALIAHTHPDSVRRAREEALRVPNPASCSTNAVGLGAGNTVWQAIDDATIDQTIQQFARQRETVRINFRGPVQAGTMNVHSAETLLRAPTVLADLVPGRLVLIGSTYADPEGKDTFDTVFGEMRGVEVHAAILDTLLGDRALRAISSWGTLVICLLLFLAMYHVAVCIRFNLIGATLVVVVSYSLICLSLLLFRDVLLPAGPGLAVVIATGIVLHNATALWYPSVRAYARIRARCRALVQHRSARSQGGISKTEDVRLTAPPQSTADAPATSTVKTGPSSCADPSSAGTANEKSR